ncbi:MAG TPA: hypothetical protein VMT93_07695 [Gemmatimonadaceae bacterium]|nr:hypothetical protein [Gemmatimonadaceae bacterium]
MSDPRSDRTLHHLHFAHRGEAAAFVAALSRFLDSPRGAHYRTPPALAEVWSHAPHAHGGVDLFLSADALAAATCAFAPVVAAGARRAGELPAPSTLLLGGERMPVWGLAEAERALGG